MAEDDLILPAKMVEWDSAFFGLRIARLDALKIIGLEEISKILEKLKNNGYELVYFFVNKEDEETCNNAVNAGGLSVGSRAFFVKNIIDNDSTPKDNSIQVYQENEVHPKLLELSLLSGTYSRFYLDKNLPKDAFTRLYETWITRSVKKEIAEHVLIYKSVEDEITGMITIGRVGKSGDVGLLSVDTKFQGQKIGARLMNEAVSYFKRENLKKLQLVTQGNNIQAVNFYIKYGFLKESEYNIFHFWL